MKINIYEAEKFDVDISVENYDDGTTLVHGFAENLQTGEVKNIEFEGKNFRDFPPVTEANVILSFVSDQLKGFIT